MRPNWKSRLRESILDWLYIARTLPAVFVKKLPWMVAMFFASWAFVYFMKTGRDAVRGF